MMRNGSPANGPGWRARAVAAVLGAALLLPPVQVARAQSGGFGKAGSSSPPASPAQEGMKPAGKSPSPSPASPARARGKPMKMSKEVEAKLDRLPPDQLVEVGGKAMTVKEIRAREAQRLRQESARVQAKAGDFPSRLEELSAKLQSAQQAEIETHNAKVRAEAEKVKRQDGTTAPAAARGDDAIKAEAMAIQRRVKAGTATPQDAARAKALYQELHQIK